MKNAVIGVAGSRSQAGEILKELAARGVAAEDVSIAPARSPEQRPRGERNALITARAAVGASAGAVIGGVVGLVVGLGHALLPWSDAPLVVGHLLAIGLAGAAGAILGAVGGTLAGLRVLRVGSARLDESKSAEQPVLIAVQTNNSEAEERAKGAFLGRPGCHVNEGSGDYDQIFDAEQLRPWGNPVAQPAQERLGSMDRRSTM